MLGVFALAFCLATASAQTTVDFNGGVASDWTSEFNMSTTGNYSWSSNTGVGTPPSGAFNANGNAGTTYKTGLSAAGNDTFKISIMLKANGVAADSATGLAFAGFGTAATSQITETNNGTDVFGIRLQGTGNAGEMIWQFRTVSAANVTSNTAFVNVSITNGSGAMFSNNAFTPLNISNWFQLSATYTKTSTNNFWGFSATYQDYGADGTTPGAVISGITGNFTQDGTYASSNLFGTVGSRNGFGNVRFSRIDNFTVQSIPEPSTFALLVVGLSAIALLRHRSRRGR